MDCYGIWSWEYNRNLELTYTNSPSRNFHGKLGGRWITCQNTSERHPQYMSPSGVYRVKWKVLGADEVGLEVEIPFGCEAVLELPCAKDLPKEQNLQAGRYEFTYHTEEPLKKILSTGIPIRELMEVPEARAMLTGMIPNLEQLPGSMLGMTLRQVMTRYGDNAEMASRFDRLDEMLGKL